MAENLEQGDLKFFQKSEPEWADIYLFAEEQDKAILDDGLENYILLSLSTNRRADSTDILPSNSTEKQGWWGDGLDDVLFGSKLWLRQNLRMSPELLAFVKQDIEEALQWMIDDDIIDALQVTVTRDTEDANRLAFLIELFKQNEGQIGFDYYFNWINQVINRSNLNAV